MFKAAKVRKSKTIRGQVYSRGNWTSEEVWVVYKSSELNNLMTVRYRSNRLAAMFSELNCIDDYSLAL